MTVNAILLTCAMYFHPRRVIVDCLAYPYTVFCRQCQVFPYNAATVSLSAPFSTTVVLHHIAQTQVRVASDGTLMVSKLRRFSSYVCSYYINIDECAVLI